MNSIYHTLSTKTPEEKIDILSSKLDYLEDAMGLALEFATIGIWDWNIKTNTLTWESNMLKLFRVHQFGGDYSDFLDLLTPECADKVDAALNSSILNHTIYDYTYELKHTPVSIRGKGKCIYDTQTNEPIRFIGVCIEHHTQ